MSTPSHIRLAWVDQTAYEYDGYGYSLYAFQYKPGFGDAVSPA